MLSALGQTINIIENIERQRKCNTSLEEKAVALGILKIDFPRQVFYC